MIRSTLSRRLAVFTAGAAVAASMLAAPASAAPGDPAWLAALDLPSDSQWAGHDEGNFSNLAANGCFGANPDLGQRAFPRIDDVTYVRSGEFVEALLVSAEVDLDGVITNGNQLEMDSVCTFAVINSRPVIETYGSDLVGGYRLEVESPTDEPQAKSGDFRSFVSVYTQPVFTDVDEYAAATLTSIGNRITRDVVTTTTPGTPKSSSQISAAQRRYDAQVKSSKGAYKKAIKKAKGNKKARNSAKKAHKQRIVRAKRIYQESVATSRTVVTKQLVETPTLFSFRLDL